MQPAAKYYPDYTRQVPAKKLPVIIVTAENLLPVTKKINRSVEPLLSHEEQEICDHATD